MLNSQQSLVSPEINIRNFGTSGVKCHNQVQNFQEIQFIESNNNDDEELISSMNHVDAYSSSSNLHQLQSTSNTYPTNIYSYYYQQQQQQNNQV